MYEYPPRFSSKEISVQQLIRGLLYPRPDMMIPAAQRYIAEIIDHRLLEYISITDPKNGFPNIGEIAALTNRAIEKSANLHWSDFHSVVLLDPQKGIIGYSNTHTVGQDASASHAFSHAYTLAALHRSGQEDHLYIPHTRDILSAEIVMIGNRPLYLGASNCLVVEETESNVEQGSLDNDFAIQAARLLEDVNQGNDNQTPQEHR